MFLKWNKTFIKKISFRLTFFYAVLFTVSSFLIFFLNYFLLEQSLKSRDHEILNAKLKEYSSIFLKGGIQELMGQLEVEKKGDNESQFLVRIETAEKKSLFLHIPEKMQNLPVKEIETKLDSLKNVNIITTFKMVDLDNTSESNDYESISLLLTQGGRIQIARNTDDRDDLLERFRRIILIISSLVLVLGVIGGYFFSNQVLAPIRNLIQMMRRVRSGELNARVPIRHSHDELDEISILFNRMTEKIERLVLNMQETLDQVAHDIKTPLTRLKTSAELVLLKPSTENEYKSALADTIENTSEIVSFVNSMMDISEAQAGVLKLNLVELNATDILTAVIDLYFLTADEKEISMKLDIVSDFFFIGDKNRTKQVLANLIDNAIKYSASGSHIKIICDGRPHGNQIRIIDQGIGISSEDLPRIWDRLFRGQEGKNQKGLGLGLSLVQSICKAHGWQIQASSQPQQGSEFILMFGPGV